MDVLTVKSAALLLDVHESTVKRWCNTGELVCSLTDGGHRRIRVEDVFSFAEREGRDIDVLEFGSEAIAVWEAIRIYRASGDDALLVGMLTDWLRAFRTDSVLSLFNFLERAGAPLADILDGPVASTFSHIGEQWKQGLLDVGTEHRMSECFTDALYKLIHDASLLQREQPSPVAIVACPESESHALGAMMIRLLLLRSGWRVVYLGRNTPSFEISRHQKIESAELVCISVSARRLSREVSVLIEELSSSYSEDHPYRMVIGGAGVELLESTQFEHPVFEKLSFFTTTAEFARQLRSGVDPTNNHVSNGRE